MHTSQMHAYQLLDAASRPPDPQPRPLVDSGSKRRFIPNVKLASAWKNIAAERVLAEEDKDSTSFLLRAIAFLSSWLIVAGFLALPPLYEKDARLRLSTVTLGVLAILSLVAGFLLSGLLKFAIRDPILRFDIVYIPGLISSSFGFLALLLNFAISERYQWNTAAVAGVVVAAVATLLYGALTMQSSRHLMKLKRRHKASETTGPESEMALLRDGRTSSATDHHIGTVNPLNPYGSYGLRPANAPQWPDREDLPAPYGSFLPYLATPDEQVHLNDELDDQLPPLPLPQASTPRNRSSTRSSVSTMPPGALSLTPRVTAGIDVSTTWSDANTSAARLDGPVLEEPPLVGLQHQQSAEIIGSTEEYEEDSDDLIRQQMLGLLLRQTTEAVRRDPVPEKTDSTDADDYQRKTTTNNPPPRSATFKIELPEEMRRALRQNTFGIIEQDDDASTGRQAVERLYTTRRRKNQSNNSNSVSARTASEASDLPTRKREQQQHNHHNYGKPFDGRKDQEKELATLKEKARERALQSLMQLPKTTYQRPSSPSGADQFRSRAVSRSPHASTVTQKSSAALQRPGTRWFSESSGDTVRDDVLSGSSGGLTWASSSRHPLSKDYSSMQSTTSGETMNIYHFPSDHVPAARLGPLDSRGASPSRNNHRIQSREERRKEIERAP